MSATETQINPADALKYVAAKVRERIEWTGDDISGSDCGHGHEIPLDALNDLIPDVASLAALFGDPETYSDGRKVKSWAEIEPGVVTANVWHPNPAAEEPRSWRGPLMHDPGTPSPGVYEVTTNPATQEIHVRVVRSA